MTPRGTGCRSTAKLGLGVLALISAGLLAGGCSRRSPPGGSAALAPPIPPAASGEGPAAIPLARGPSWEERDDAARDGWDTEVFSARAQQQLDVLSELVFAPREPEAGRLEALLAADFACGPLRPGDREMVFRDDLLRVERARIAAPGSGESAPADHRGAAGFREALTAAGEPFRNAAEARFKLKIIGVETGGDSVTTRQHLEAFCRRSGTLLEWTAAWTIRWEPAPGGAPPRMRSIRVEAHEEAGRSSPERLFSDCTASVLGKNPAWREQFLRGYNHWLERIQDHRFFSILGTPGLAVGDVDGDGLDDLYAGQEGGLPNRLFLQNPDGSARDASESSGADWIESTRGVLLADLDNDGDQDLAAAVLGALVLAANDGRARFEIRAVLPASHDTMSLSAADYDRDGDLDLHLCAYKRDDLVEESGVISIDQSDDFLYHDANDGAPDLLYRNELTVPWRFTDATRDTGLDANNRRYGFAAAWEDFDRDGDPDLYVANDFGLNNLYRNDAIAGGAVRFTDVASSAGAEDRAASMSVSWGDFNRDGWPDLYVGNMFSSAGGRITTQPGFQPRAGSEVRARLRRFARGNTLLQNLGNGTFRDVSEEAGVTMGRWAWSSVFADFNNDGLEDLFVANGYLTTEDPGDL